MKNIVNLTPYNLRPELIKEGVYEPHDKEYIIKQYDFNSVPTKEIIKARARLLAAEAKREKADYALIEGPGWFMIALEKELLSLNIKPIYSFMVREIRKLEIDGKIKRTKFFIHKGFIEHMLD